MSLMRATRVSTKLAKVGQALGKALTAELVSGENLHAKELQRLQLGYKALIAKKADRFDEAAEADAILQDADAILSTLSSLFPSIPAPIKKEGKGSGDGKNLKRKASEMVEEAPMAPAAVAAALPNAPAADA
eukprot:542541-Amphidinium_carterae.1